MDAPGVPAVPEPSGAAADRWHRSPVPHGGPPSAGSLRGAAPNVRPDPLIDSARGGTLRLPMRTTQWTHQRIVDVLIEERLFSGTFPRRSDWRHVSELHPCSETVVKAFGTWRAALAAADRQAPVENQISVPAPVVEFVLAACRRVPHAGSGRSPSGSATPRPTASCAWVGSLWSASSGVISQEQPT